MRKTTLTGAKGLLTTGRMLDAGSNGYLGYCENVLVREDGIMTPRFGLEAAASTQSGVTALIYDQVNNQTLRTSYTTDLLDKGDGVSWTSLDSTRKYGFEAVGMRKRTYLLSDDGLMRINAGNSAVEVASIPEGLDPYAVTTGTGWLGAGTRAAYVCLWGIKDADDDFYLGAPSGRFVVTNSGSTATNVQVTMPIPAGITANHFFQIYRTPQSGGVDIDPGADYRLVYEAYPTVGELAAGVVVFTDYVANNGGGAALYTNEQEQTSLLANSPCEAILSSGGAGRLALFADCLFASNYQPRSSLFLSLLGVQTPNGLNAFTATSTTNSNTTLNGIAAADWERLAVGMRVEGADIPVNTTIQALGAVGTVTLSQAATGSSTTTRTFYDVVTIGGVEYYAYTSENIANRQFLVPSLTATPDPGMAIRQTCESFIRVFNRSASNTIAYASYLSGPDEFPGRMVIRCRTDRASTYTMFSTHGWAWSPNLFAAKSIQSIGDTGVLLISKPNEPFAWPLVSTVQLGGNVKIYELAALRGALLVFTNIGLYRVTGTFNQWSVDLLDANAILTVSSGGLSRGVTVVDNVAYCVTARGVLACTETATRVISTQIAATIANRAAPDVMRLSSHKADGTVFVPVESCGTYVYQPRLMVWTMLKPILNCGDYDISNRRMCFNDPALALTRRQRDATYAPEYVYDKSHAVTVSSIIDSVATLSAPVPAGVAVGDVIVFPSSIRATISAVNGSDVTFVLATGASAPTTGPATIYEGFDVLIRYAPITAGPGSRKNWVSGALQFDTPEPSASAPSTPANYDLSKYITVGFLGDVMPTSESISGMNATPDHAHEFPLWVTPLAKRATALTITAAWRNAYMYPRLVGATLYIDDESEKAGR